MASRSWNRVELIGNLTRDPELRYTPNGAAVCTFGLATNRTYVSDGEKKEEVDFHRLVSWNKLAELCNQLLKKGMRVFISGRLQTRSWEGQDNQTRTVTEIVIEDMIILTPKGDYVGVPAGEEAFAANIPVREEVAPAPVESEPKEESKEPEAASGPASPSSAEASEPKEEAKKPAKAEPAPKEDVDDLPF